MKEDTQNSLFFFFADTFKFFRYFSNSYFIKSSHEGTSNSSSERFKTVSVSIFTGKATSPNPQRPIEVRISPRIIS